MMEEKKSDFKRVFRAEGVDFAKATRWLAAIAPLKVSGSVKLTLDAGALTTAFPLFAFKGGKNATVKITYSESLFVGNEKRERDHPDGRVFEYSDLIRLD
ncbi:MAG: hypothetical protein WCI03_07875 [bacterium]